jgi:hypothetical protein
MHFNSGVSAYQKQYVDYRVHLPTFFVIKNVSAAKVMLFY